MRKQFVQAVRENQQTFGLALSNDAVDRLADYYELIQEHNPLLHLVGPCPPEEFATRHILESLTLLQFLPNDARFADVGTGAGLPSIPCLIARDDLHGVLIESKEKKANFLHAAIQTCGLDGRVEVIDRQFSETPRPSVSHVTCRALDKFGENLPRLLKWAGPCTLLFFSGPTLEEKLNELGLTPRRYLLPMSEQRFLFVAKNRRVREQ